MLCTVVVIVIVKKNCNCKWIKSKEPTKVRKQPRPQGSERPTLNSQQPTTDNQLNRLINGQRKLSLKCTSTRIARKVRPLWCSHRRPSLGSVFTVNNEATRTPTHPSANPPAHQPSGPPSTGTHLLISHFFSAIWRIQSQAEKKETGKSLNDFCCFSKCFLMVYVCRLCCATAMLFFQPAYAQF